MKITGPLFWRDSQLPFLEARSILDGRKVCYSRHSHEMFSVGVVTSGSCRYVNGTRSETVGAGSVVLMNPGDVHACNPMGDERWSYIMLYFDVPWLNGLQYGDGATPSIAFTPFAAISSTRRELYDGLKHLFGTLCNPEVERLEKQSTAVSYMNLLRGSLRQGDIPQRAKHPKLTRAAEFIRANCERSLQLDEICAAAGLCASYLIRAFKEVYGLTPHAYLTNCRIEVCRAQLRLGRPIAEVAAAAGFSDQAHLHRSFKKLVAATPGQYRT